MFEGVGLATQVTCHADNKTHVNELGHCIQWLKSATSWYSTKADDTPDLCCAVIFQQYYSYVLQIIYVISEENKMLLRYPPHLKNVTALPCEMHKFFIFYILSHALNTNPQYRRVVEASCCDVDWISAQRGALCSWSVAKKDWKHVSVHKVVTLNICCNVVCLMFHLSHITTGFFQSHQCQPTTGFFQSHQRLEEYNIPSVRWKSCAFYKVVRWHFSGVVGRR